MTNGSWGLCAWHTHTDAYTRDSLVYTFPLLWYYGYCYNVWWMCARLSRPRLQSPYRGHWKCDSNTGFRRWTLAIDNTQRIYIHIYIVSSVRHLKVWLERLWLSRSLWTSYTCSFALSLEKLHPWITSQRRYGICRSIERLYVYLTIQARTTMILRCSGDTCVVIRTNSTQDIVCSGIIVFYRIYLSIYIDR